MGSAGLQSAVPSALQGCPSDSSLAEPAWIFSQDPGVVLVPQTPEVPWAHGLRSQIYVMISVDQALAPAGTGDGPRAGSEHCRTAPLGGTRDHGKAECMPGMLAWLAPSASSSWCVVTSLHFVL